MKVKESLLGGIFEILEEEDIETEEIQFLISLLENPESELYHKLNLLINKI